jgi:hypothetical protein
MEIKDCTGCLDRVADGSRARRDPVRVEFFVLVNKTLQQAFLRCNRIQGLDIQLPQSLNVNRPSFLAKVRLARLCLHPWMKRRTLSILW